MRLIRTLKELVRVNSRTTVHELALVFDVSPMTISNHLAAIGKVKKLDKWVSHELKDKHKTSRFEITSSLLIRDRT